jgi:hypothetical protein
MHAGYYSLGSRLGDTLHAAYEKGMLHCMATSARPTWVAA